MQDLVQDALDNAEAEKRDMDVSMDDDEFGDPRIVIVGAGGAGNNNTVNRLYNIGVDGADTVAINTDKQHLKMIEADTKILVGKSLTQGLGAGGDPKMGSVPPRWPRGRSKRFSATPTSSSSPPGWAAAPALVRRQLSRKIAKDQGAIVVVGWSRPRSTSSAPAR